MQFKVLGPLEIVENGTQISLQSLNQRATLGYLLLRPNRVVSIGLLIKALWGEDAPATARKMLQNAVAGVRSVVSRTPGAELVTRVPGYMIKVNPDDIDLSRFHALVARGRTELSAGSPEAGIAILREALRLWRGSALEDLTEAGLCWPELTVMQDTRMSAFEDCMAAELNLGRHFEIMDELETAFAEEPLRERLCGQLMLGLYRCGRQAEALRVYERARADYLGKPGADLGQELHELERAIREHDPALSTHAGNRVCFIQAAFR